MARIDPQSGRDRPSATCVFPPRITPDRRARLVGRHLDLIESEAVIAVLLVEGLTIKEMSARIGRSVSTVKGRLERIALRLRTRNSHQISALVLAVLWWCACTEEE
ncbi:MAG: hypothetical protein U0974_01460 [Gemmatimonadales bacterium]|nr:hypothetical protein [Gemmatimonadales bacterium]MDZ4388384.1 hypothetical protein [Gemmatimonadales bacterium]